MGWPYPTPVCPASQEKGLTGLTLWKRATGPSEAVMWVLALWLGSGVAPDR